MRVFLIDVHNEKKYYTVNDITANKIVLKGEDKQLQSVTLRQFDNIDFTLSF